MWEAFVDYGMVDRHKTNEDLVKTLNVAHWRIWEGFVSNNKK